MDGLDLTDDFLDSLDTLTTICTHGKRADSGEYAATATEEDEDEEAGGAEHGAAAAELEDARLSEFTPEELQQFAFYHDDDAGDDVQRVVIAEEEEEEEEEEDKREASDAFEQPEASMVRRLGNGALLHAGAYDQAADDEDDEYADEVAQLESPDLYASYYSDSLLKPSYQSDGTERSYSFASECTDFSPVHSPQEVTLDRSYEQRLEASVRGNDSANRHTQGSNGGGSNANREAGEHSASGSASASGADSATAMTPEAARAFTMEDLAYFDPHFGRDVFLDELGGSFIDGSGSRSLASYRMSSVFRISQNKSDIIKQGWLMKRGEFVRSWHKRWFTLRRMPQGPMLTYSRDSSENAPAKVIDLSSTSRCVVAPKPSKDHEFRIVTSADSKRREYAAYGVSNYELTEWVRAIQSAINAGNKSAFEGAADLQRIWNETGIQGFLVRYGMRKVSSRNHMQTRVLELNFADQTITNSRRGESLSTLHFNDLLRVTPTKQGNEEFGLVLDFNGKHRSWVLFLDTCEARDDLQDILEKIAIKEVIGEDLEARCSRLRLKSGFLERRNVGPQATLKGRLFVCLYENSIVLYPDGEDVNTARPWYVVTLKGLNVSCNEGKCSIAMGRLQLTCASTEECRNWYQAILAAMSLPSRVVDLELRERAKIRNTFHSTVYRLRKLLKANVKPEKNGPPKDQKTIELMMRKLWELTFVGEPFTSNADPRWQELGFQRGGPASDLRSSGLLGLYTLTYFVTHPSGEFTRILDRTRFGVSEGDMKNYPLAIGCINVVAMLTETLGFGDAGSHSAGCSPYAMKTFVRFIADTVSEPKRTPRSTRPDPNMRSSMSGNALNSFDTWEDIVAEADNYVFEDMFCVLYPILDTLFVQMGAGYMEFGQVVAAFRRRIGTIFDALPRNMEELQELALEPVTDETLVAPSIISKGMK